MDGINDEKAKAWFEIAPAENRSALEFKLGALK